MASLSEIRDALNGAIQAHCPELNYYATVPDAVQVPALVICPDEADFNGAMGRGLDTWTFHLYVLVARVESRLAQEQLDQYVTGAGPKSIRKIVYEEGDHLLPDTQMHCTGVRGYGGSFETASVQHIGAILRLQVHTRGGA